MNNSQTTLFDKLSNSNQIAVTLAVVKNYKDLVVEAIEKSQFGIASMLLDEEMKGYLKATELLKSSDSEMFIEYFSTWLPEKIKDTDYAIKGVNELIKRMPVLDNKPANMFDYFTDKRLSIRTDNLKKLFAIADRTEQTLLVDYIRQELATMMN